MYTDELVVLRWEFTLKSNKVMTITYTYKRGYFIVDRYTKRT